MIRSLAVGDAAAVAALDAEIFGSNAWSLAAWEQEAATSGPDRRYLVHTDRSDAGPGPVGLMGYSGVLRAGSDADILTVAVAPAARGRGIGKLLVAALLEIAEGWRSQAVYLEVEQDNSAAAGLYRGLGFTEMGVRRHYYGQHRHALTMRRQLREPMGSVLLGGAG